MLSHCHFDDNRQSNIRRAKADRVKKTLENGLLEDALTKAGSRIVLAVVAAAIVPGFTAAEADPLWPVEPSAEFQNINTSHATITRIKQSSTAERYALRVDFQPAKRPQIEFSLPAFKVDSPPFNAIALEVSNPLNEPIRFVVEVERNGT
jgi:hypothetical protein